MRCALEDTAGGRSTEGDGSRTGLGERTLYRGTQRVLARVVVLLRAVAVPPLASAIVLALHTKYYTAPWLAVAVYLVLAAWWVTFAVVVLLRLAVPAWVVVTDVAVLSGCMVVLRFAVSVRFLTGVLYSDLEAALMVTAVAVAMNLRPRWAVTGCGVLAAAHVIAEIPAMRAAEVSLVETVTDLGWLAGAALTGGMIAHHLRTASRSADVATGQVLAQREQLAAQQARADERTRYYHEQIRRYRALHDGPMSILAAMGGRGPLAHPNEQVRRQCAVGANLLRGLVPDGPNSSLTDLSLALIEAGTDCALRGLRVEYQFSDLPDDLGAAVVEALSGASREALNNVAAHAGVDKAWLTTLANDDPDLTRVIVAIVDQGKGFDTETTPWGRGLNDSILGRMAEVGGTAMVDSYVGQGTRIELRWPA